MIEHLAAPRFTARWTTGEFPIDQVRHGTFFWTDEGSGGEDAIHLYEFEWRDVVKGPSIVTSLMVKAVEVIEEGVLRRT